MPSIHPSKLSALWTHLLFPLSKHQGKCLTSVLKPRESPIFNQKILAVECGKKDLGGATGRRPGLDQFHILRHKGSHSTLAWTSLFDVDVQNGRFGSSVTPYFWGRAKKSWRIPSWMGKNIYIHILYYIQYICYYVFLLFSVPKIGDLRCYAPLLRFVRCHQSGSLPVKQSGTKWACTSTSSWKKDWSKIQGSFNLQTLTTW